jgi:hypothetical protein
MLHTSICKEGAPKLARGVTPIDAVFRAATTVKVIEKKALTAVNFALDPLTID